MRKLFTGILLAAALPASASITSDIEAGELATADIINNAIAACGGSASCQELAIEEAVAAGVDITSVVNLAIASGVDAGKAIAAATAAGLKAGQSQASIDSAIAAADGIAGNLPATAGGTGTGFNTAPQTTSTSTAPATTTTTGISQAN